MTKYKDYMKIEFGENEISYRIGKNSGFLLTADSILFLATEECYVKFNNESSYIPIPKGDYFEWGGPIDLIYVKRKTKDGILEVWSEGGRKLNVS